jgi:hypothetical protein
MSIDFIKNFSKINILFIFFSVGYIYIIFFLSDSSVAQTLSQFNPYSLLHIPLYGILTLLLYLSFKPNLSIKNISNIKPEEKLFLPFFLPPIISICVAILDEIHQLYIPFREASIGDIFLDSIGISITTILLIHLRNKH